MGWPAARFRSPRSPGQVAGRPVRRRVPRPGLVSCLFSIAAATACDGADAGRARRAGASAYPDILAAAERERIELAVQWRRARSPAEEGNVLGRASAALARQLADRILPAWVGTPWSLSGAAGAPGGRPIACGYFVSTALAHAGLEVDRPSLARQAAEDIVLSLVPEERIARFRRAPLDQFLARVAAGGDGVYVVGLDRHVGFLVIDGGTAFFHHSSREAGAVVREPAILSDALATSSYRVAGKLSGPVLARSWLAGWPIRTRTR